MSTRPAPSPRAVRQRAVLSECRAAMPPALAPLWETILHAPDAVMHNVLDALARSLPGEEERLLAVLGWFGHGDGSCPVCWMLVGRLVFSVPEPIRALTSLTRAEVHERHVQGACLFLSGHLEPRHALPVGVTRERLAALRGQVRGLPVALKERLLAHWAARGGRVDALSCLH